jgi:methylenetetrahydrofolate--tRNA-(uracil-5-)-methyltransferase
LRFAGQITGCEGYVESTSVGLMAGVFMAAEILGSALPPPPETSALGAVLAHITGGAKAETYQPMNVNFGLFPEPEAKRGENGRKIKGRDRKKLYTERAYDDLTPWLEVLP